MDWSSALDRKSSAEMIRYMIHMNQVDGWLTPTTAHLIRSILSYQSMKGIDGNAMEIGVHHGRLFILLCLGLKSNEHGVAIDLFDLQHLNIDHSGSGSLDALRANLKHFAPDTKVEFVKGDSSRLRSAIIKNHPKMRFVSVDGGHTRELTENDLWIAQEVLVDGGVVALDDIYRGDWSGVTAGIASYYKKGGSLIPFALSPNKAFLTNSNKSASSLQNLITQYFELRPGHERQQFFDFDNVLLVEEKQSWNPETWGTEWMANSQEILKENNRLKALSDQLWQDKIALIDEINVIKSKENS